MTADHDFDPYYNTIYRREDEWAFWAIIFVSALLGIVFSLLAILLIRPCMNFYRKVYWEFDLHRGRYKKLDQNENGDYKQWEIEVPRQRHDIPVAPKSADPRSGGFGFRPLSPRRLASYHSRSHSNQDRPPQKRVNSNGGTGTGLGIHEEKSAFLHPP